MNYKRWIAVGLAVVVFFSSLVISLVGKSLSQNIEEAGAKSFLQEMMDDSLSENVLRKGNLGERILVVNVRGTIMNVEDSFLNVSQYNHQQILQSLEKVKDDETIKGMIVRIDSPGGGVYESAELNDKIREVKEARDIPIYVAMESMAASGGYYIAAAADQIYATKETITGSIGVIMGGMNYSELMTKLGIEDTTIKSGELKDVGSATRAMTEKDVAVLQGLVNSMYERFVDVVAQGRGMDREAVYKLADGRIYDGSQAQKNGLVDKIGYYEEALEDFEAAYDLESAQVFTYKNSQEDILSQLFMKTGQALNLGQAIKTGTLDLPANWKEESGFMYIYEGY